MKCYIKHVLNQKILKQVEYESARRKRHINEETRKRDEEGSTLFLWKHFFFHFSCSRKEFFDYAHALCNISYLDYHDSFTYCLIMKGALW